MSKTKNYATFNDLRNDHAILDGKINYLIEEITQLRIDLGLISIDDDEPEKEENLN